MVWEEAIIQLNMRYARLPSGQIRYYWVDEVKDSKWFLSDAVDGLNGVRRWLLDVIPDNESIIDIGCGPGTVYEIFRLAGRKNDYLGVDRDLEILKLAQSLSPDAKFENEDCNFLPYPDNSIDHCILFTVVDMISDFRKAIEEAVRVSRKQVIITTFVPLIDEPDKNQHTPNIFGDYVVNINRKRFIDFINAFGFKVTSGELMQDGEIEYWWWRIEKSD